MIKAMVTAADIRELPRDEKLRIMELIWSDLNSSGDEVESPVWHETALRETAERVESGEESPVDWSAAKEQLRAERK